MTNVKHILFDGDNVRAILREENPKTQTRLPVKPQPVRHVESCTRIDRLDVVKPRGWRWRDTYAADERVEWFCGELSRRMPYRVGDMLWVRETFQQVHPCQVADGRFYMPGQAGIPGPPMVKYRVVYRADGDVEEAHFVDGFPYRCVGGSNPEHGSAKWTPSIHMPKWAARIWLEVTDVRIQRVQDITDADAMAEGVDPYECPSGPANPWPQQAFLEMWQRLYGKNESLSVRANPWVAAYTFKRIERPEVIDG